MTTQPINRAAFPQQRPAQVVAPAPTAPAPIAHPVPAGQGPANRPAPVAPLRPPASSQSAIEHPAQVAQPEPVHSNAPPPAPVRTQPVASQSQRPAPRPPDQPRPLINKTPPAPVQPPFAQQKSAIQSIDPGRPLGPQQVDNLRNGRPAGPAQNRKRRTPYRRLARTRPRPANLNPGNPTKSSPERPRR